MGVSEKRIRQKGVGQDGFEDQALSREGLGLRHLGAQCTDSRGQTHRKKGGRTICTSQLQMLLKGEAPQASYAREPGITGVSRAGVNTAPVQPLKC